MSLVNMKRKKFTDTVFVETAEMLHENHDEKITYKMLSEQMGCSLQTVRQHIPDEAKEIIKMHNSEVSLSISIDKIEEAIKYITNGGKDKVSVGHIKNLTHVKEYALIKRIINKYSK